jgi:hypothetical protein
VEIILSFSPNSPNFSKENDIKKIRKNNSEKKK